jgi:hypothetical protein
VESHFCLLGRFILPVAAWTRVACKLDLALCIQCHLLTLLASGFDFERDSNGCSVVGTSSDV